MAAPGPEPEAGKTGTGCVNACVRVCTPPCNHSGRDETAQTKSNAHMAESIIMPSEIA